ncbi:MAG: hypothetical protein P4L53_27990 [Candidatus Obscuribacterales bacterium]|nr:hypothetical protein [Candidatus Obscuribacterales bacterium]
MKTIGYKQTGTSIDWFGSVQSPVVIELPAGNEFVEKELTVDASEYNRLQVGALELALVDPWFQGNVILYRFCKYRLTE